MYRYRCKSSRKKGRFVETVARSVERSVDWSYEKKRGMTLLLLLLVLLLLLLLFEWWIVNIGGKEERGDAAYGEIFASVIRCSLLLCRFRWIGSRLDRFNTYIGQLHSIHSWWLCCVGQTSWIEMWLKVGLVVAVLGCVCLQCDGFYLPGVAPTDFVVVRICIVYG